MNCLVTRVSFFRNSVEVFQFTIGINYWQFGRPILGGNFWFPGWFFFSILCFGIHTMPIWMFSPEFFFALFFYPMYPSNKPTVCKPPQLSCAEDDRSLRFSTKILAELSPWTKTARQHNQKKCSKVVFHWIAFTQVSKNPD